MVGGAYSYTIPTKYFPNYRVVRGDKNLMPSPDYDPNMYTFSYDVALEAPRGKAINYLSAPSFALY